MGQGADAWGGAAPRRRIDQKGCSSVRFGWILPSLRIVGAEALVIEQGNDGDPIADQECFRGAQEFRYGGAGSDSPPRTPSGIIPRFFQPAIVPAVPDRKQSRNVVDPGNRQPRNRGWCRS